MLLLRSLCVLISILASTTLPAVAASGMCSEPVRVRVSPDYLPFSYKDTSGAFRGIDIALIQSLFEKIGCEFDLVAIPFKRAIVELAEGRIDMMPFASITEERKLFAHFSAPYRNETAGLIVRAEDKDQLKIKSLQDIIDQSLLLGHEQSAYRGEAFANFLTDPEARLHVYNLVNTTQGIRMLANGRIDALVESPAAILAAAEDMGLGSRFAEHTFTLTKEPVHFMYSKKTVSPEFIATLDREIASTIKSGEYQSAYGSMALPQ